MIEVALVPAFRDNYIFLAHDRESGATAAVDPGDAAPALAEAERRGWRIDQVLITHWHPDHAGGLLAIKRATGATATGPAREAERIPGLDRLVAEPDRVGLGRHTARVLDVEAHTGGHIAYVFEEARIAFVGDTLFAMGCGRLLEGTAPMMWAALAKLMALPDDTTVYCAHEYTQANGRFALTAEPGNAAIATRMEEVARLRAEGRPTVPTTIGLERATNPFVRAGSAERLSELRAAKDAFQG